MSLDFTPQMVNRDDNTIIVIGTSGELAKLDFNYEYISPYSKPFPTTIMSGVLFENNRKFGFAARSWQESEKYKTEFECTNLTGR